MGSYLHPNMVKKANFRGLCRIERFFSTLRGIMNLPRWQLMEHEVDKREVFLSEALKHCLKMKLAEKPCKCSSCPSGFGFDISQQIID